MQKCALLFVALALVEASSNSLRQPGRASPSMPISVVAVSKTKTGF
jgi:hypothetical protein